MDKRMEENVRVKNAITKAFFTLLEAKPYEEISVTEITNRAKVSRMAYYRNFDSKLEILEYFLARTFEGMAQELGEEINFWTLEYGRVYFHFMKEHRDSILLLDKLGFSGLILNAFNATNEEIAGDMPRNSIERYRLYYAAGASYNAMIHWLKEGCKESVEDMARFTGQFIGIVD